MAKTSAKDDQEPEPVRRSPAPSLVVPKLPTKAPALDADPKPGATIPQRPGE